MGVGLLRWRQKRGRRKRKRKRKRDGEIESRFHAKMTQSVEYEHHVECLGRCSTVGRVEGHHQKTCPDQAQDGVEPRAGTRSCGMSIPTSNVRLRKRNSRPTRFGRMPSGPGGLPNLVL